MWSRPVICKMQSYLFVHAWVRNGYRTPLFNKLCKCLSICVIDASVIIRIPTELPRWCHVWMNKSSVWHCLLSYRFLVALPTFEYPCLGTKAGCTHGGHRLAAGSRMLWNSEIIVLYLSYWIDPFFWLINSYFVQEPLRERLWNSPGRTGNLTPTPLFKYDFSNLHR